MILFIKIEAEIEVEDGLSQPIITVTRSDGVSRKLIFKVHYYFFKTIFILIFHLN